jgi:hypothetical protein
MKSENMAKAYEAFHDFQVQLRLAKNDAISAQDRFADLHIAEMLEDVVQIDWRIKRMVEAAK